MEKSKFPIVITALIAEDRAMGSVTPTCVCVWGGDEATTPHSLYHLDHCSSFINPHQFEPPVFQIYSQGLVSQILTDMISLSRLSLL